MGVAIAGFFRSLLSKIKWLLRLWPILVIASVAANSYFVYEQQQDNFRLARQTIVREADVDSLSERIDEVEDIVQEVQAAVDALEIDLLLADDNTKRKLDGVNSKLTSIDLKLANIDLKFSGIEFDIDKVKTDIIFMDECTQSKCSYHFSLMPSYRF